MAGTEASAPRGGKLKLQLQHRFSTRHCQVKLEVSSAVLLCDSRRDTVKWTPSRFVYFFVFGLLFR